MEVQTLLLIFIIVPALSNYVFAPVPRTDVVYSDGDSVSLDCGPWAVLDIHWVGVALVSEISDCTVDQILPQTENENTWQPCEEKFPLAQCHGSNNCSVSSDPNKWTCTHPKISRPDALKISYSCHHFDRDTTVSVGSTSIGVDIDILSPNFPCIVPPQKIRVTCQIQVHSNVTSETKVIIKVKLLTFPKTPDECDQKLSVESGSYLEEPEVCSESSKRVRRREGEGEIIILSSGSIEKIIYEKNIKEIGGKFWIYLSAERSISVSCDKSSETGELQNQKNGRCNPFSFTSTEEPSSTGDYTAMSTTEHFGGSPIINPEIENEASNNDDSEIYAEDPSSVPSGTDENSGTLPAIIGGVVGLLIFIVLGASVLIYLRRRSKHAPSTVESPPAEKLALPLQTPSAPPYETVPAPRPSSTRGPHLLLLPVPEREAPAPV